MCQEVFLTNLKYPSMPRKCKMHQYVNILQLFSHNASFSFVVSERKRESGSSLESCISVL